MAPTLTSSNLAGGPQGPLISTARVFWIVTGWLKGTTVDRMYIEADQNDAYARLHKIVDDRPPEVDRVTIEGPWSPGDDINKEDRVFLTVFID
jgi:hypothetical protein